MRDCRAKVGAAQMPPGPRALVTSVRTGALSAPARRPRSLAGIMDSVHLSPEDVTLCRIIRVKPRAHGRPSLVVDWLALVQPMASLAAAGAQATREQVTTYVTTGPYRRLQDETHAITSFLLGMRIAVLVFQLAHHEVGKPLAELLRSEHVRRVQEREAFFTGAAADAPEHIPMRMRQVLAFFQARDAVAEQQAMCDIVRLRLRHVLASVVSHHLERRMEQVADHERDGHGMLLPCLLRLVDDAASDDVARACVGHIYTQYVRKAVSLIPDIHTRMVALFDAPDRTTWDNELAYAREVCPLPYSLPLWDLLDETCKQHEELAWPDPRRAIDLALDMDYLSLDSQPRWPADWQPMDAPPLDDWSIIRAYASEPRLFLPTAPLVDPIRRLIAPDQPRADALRAVAFKHGWREDIDGFVDNEINAAELFADLERAVTAPPAPPVPIPSSPPWPTPGRDVEVDQVRLMTDFDAAVPAIPTTPFGPDTDNLFVNERHDFDPLRPLYHQ